MEKDSDSINMESGPAGPRSTTLTPESAALSPAGHSSSQRHSKTSGVALVPGGLRLECETATVDLKDWKHLVDFKIPGYLDAHIIEIPQIVALYESYRSCYANLTISSAVRMQYTKAFAFALLSHYYTEEQGLVIEPHPLGPIAKNGLNFILAAQDKSDKWNFDPPTETPKKGKRRGSLNKKQRDKMAKAEYDYSLSYLEKLQWHMITAEDIAAFVIQHDPNYLNSDKVNARDFKLPRTFLTIMVDRFDLPLRFSTENVMQRSDVLADLLCSKGGIEKGHGILVHGPFIEIYDFTRGPEWVNFDGNDSDDEPAQDIEPHMALANGPLGFGKLALDTRTVGLEELDSMFQYVRCMGVSHDMVLERMSEAESQGEAVNQVDGGFLLDMDMEANPRPSTHHPTALELSVGSGTDQDAEGEDDDGM